MQRHLSTGSALVSALMAAQRAREPGQRSGDVVRLLASLGDRGERAAPARPAMWLTPAQPAMRLTPAQPAMRPTMRPTTRDEDLPPASR